MRLLVITLLLSLSTSLSIAQTSLDELITLSNDGDGAATYNAAKMLHDGTQVERDIPRAIELYKKAAAENYYPAGLPLGRIYSSQMVFEIDMDYTKEMLQFAASDPQGGDHVKDAAYFLAQIYIGDKAGNRTIYKWLELAADNGHPGAAADVGYQYFSGQKLRKDPTKAYKYSGMAANLGHGASQYNFAVMHNQGAGTAKDNVAALTWFMVAADTDKRFDNGTVEKFENGLTASQVAKAKRDAKEIIARFK